MARFRSKTQAMNQRKHCWACLKCGHLARRKMKACEVCHSTAVQYFPSHKELRRYQELRLLQDLGQIQDLKLQVDFPLSVNGHLIGKYRADFQYRENGELITEDCKGVATDVFVLKSKLVKALHGVDIKLT